MEWSALVEILRSNDTFKASFFDANKVCPQESPNTFRPQEVAWESTMGSKVYRT